MSNGSPSASPDADFRPGASLERLRTRAAVLAAARAFFAARGVLEVETPVLCAAGAVDAHLEPIPVRLPAAAAAATGEAEAAMYLVTSPEHSMKRLLAAGSGSIYQVTRAFRAGERGRLHNPEFTILEWYRPGFDHLRLMEEVEDLACAIFAAAAVGASGLARPPRPFARVTYRAAFERALGIDPHRAPATELVRAAERAGVTPPAGLGEDDRDGWLNLLLAAAVEPTLGVERPLFLTDYPASQAALARVRPGEPPVAERFELYSRGVELANGYHELLDQGEQESRFAAANRRRESDGRTLLPLDRRFLAALAAGVPACAGVALGLDRLVMLAAAASSIDEVLAFPIERA
jgi:lysyl-tRNA synthetase class 2